MDNNNKEIEFDSFTKVAQAFQKELLEHLASNNIMIDINNIDNLDHE